VKEEWESFHNGKEKSEWRWIDGQTGRSDECRDGTRGIVEGYPPPREVRVSVGMIGVTRESHGSVGMIGVSGRKNEEKANKTFRIGNWWDCWLIRDGVVAATHD
jgi:hypothetical protein